MKSFDAKRQGGSMGILFITANHAVRCEQRSALSPKFLRTRGFALAWTALVIFVLLLLVGLSIDTGKLCLVNHQLQNGADAGALAGALYVKFNQNHARSIAVTTAESNYADKLSISVDNNLSNDPNGELVFGRWIRQLQQFIPTTISPSAVKVVSRRLGQRDSAPQISYIFGPLANVYSAPLARDAIAWSIVAWGAGIITLAEEPRIYDDWNHDTGLVMHGNIVVDLRGINAEDGNPMIGDIQVNSQSTRHPWASFRLTGGTAEIWTGEFNISGTSNPDADDTDTWASIYADPYSPFSVNPERDPIADPLAGVPAPDVDSMTTPFSNVINDSYVSSHGVAEVDPVTGEPTGVRVLTLSPGYYPGGINLSADPTSSKIILTGGTDAVYAFGGGSDGKSGLVMTGGTLIGDGVMIYVTGDGNEGPVQWGKIEIHGNTDVQITSRGDAQSPPSVNGEIGIAIWQDRNNPTYGKIVGGGNMSIVGTIYCGYNPMEIGGDSDQMGNQLIAGALNLHGNSPIRIAYDGRNALEIFNRSILVK
jgi:Flp pilus assembly protein TadG